MRSHLVGPLLLVIGLVLVGQVALDDTGDDIGGVTVDAAGSVAADRDAGGAALAGAVTDGPLTSDPLAAAASDDGPVAAPSGADDPSDEDNAEGVSTRAPAPRIGTSSARLEDLDVSAPPAPTDLALPAIGIEAPVVPVGIDEEGLMTVPDDVLTVGWYQYGRAPGSGEGTTVIAGHVDSRTQGRGAFFELRSLAVGDAVTVTDEDGTQSVWRVTGRRTYEKSSLPIEDLYRRDGSPRLVLITCGGDFDDVDRHYESNVVVEAEPIS